MRMMMRPQKRHLPSLIKVTSGSVQVDRRKYDHAGYLTFDAMVVGGSGGFGGRSWHNDNHNVYGAGGGGGGCVRFWGSTDILNSLFTLQAGAAGSDGADKGNGQTGGTGGTGGTSKIGPENQGDAWWEAYGGKGGTGGRVNHTSGIGSSGFLSDGGDGGSNSVLLGSGGIGSTGLNAAENPNHTAATQGVASVSGSTLGGKGGGGETGRAKLNGVIEHATVDAKSGNVNATYGTTAPGGGASTTRGPAGGGANIAPITGGSAEYYGSRASGQNDSGVAVIKFS